MRLLKGTNKKFHLFKTSSEYKFRYENVLIPSKKNNFIFMNGVFTNPFIKYRMITSFLNPGTYKFRVNSKDDLSNVNNGEEVSIVIPAKLFHPLNFRITELDGNDITFTWSVVSTGITPTGYKIYGNGGSGYVIDRNTVLATMTQAETTETITVANGSWIFVIESYTATVETENYFSTEITVPITNTPSESVPGISKIYGVELKNVSVGKCNIDFSWEYGAEASYFLVYHDNATGTIDWNTYAYRFARQNSVRQNYLTAQLCSIEQNVLYKFGIRFENQYGNVDTNTEEYEVYLDGVEPDEVEDITGEAV